ncbi:uncharacterized protein LOC132198028 [Neocloeon triangulifer]|uniref:uncharacterized protein LOC132198028 n=1 Tax=Neocloeon triangulifer TaxID=2078957 RepID=UPI00286F7AC1|nr:uncharacterized protein LOC132198028 [Neocloeon triangulifer]
MPGCVVAWCGQNSSVRIMDPRLVDRKVTFHNLPSDSAMKKLWVQALRHGGRADNWEPSPNAKICSLHFDPQELQYNGRLTNIKRGAVPKIAYSAIKKRNRRNNKHRPDVLQSLVQNMDIEETCVPDVPATVDMKSIVQIEESNTYEFPVYLDDLALSVLDEQPSQEKSKKVVKLPENHTFVEDALAKKPAEVTLESLLAKVMSALQELNDASAKNSEVAKGVEQLISQASDLRKAVCIADICNDLEKPATATVPRYFNEEPTEDVLKVPENIYQQDPFANIFSAGMMAYN